jgi:hypothetical protein
VRERLGRPLNAQPGCGHFYDYFLNARQFVFAVDFIVQLTLDLDARVDGAIRHLEFDLWQ